MSATGDARDDGRKVRRAIEPPATAGRLDALAASGPEAGSPDRRSVMKLMGAALAMAGLTACSPAEKILPYVRQPENVVPGRPLHFATTLPIDGFGFGAVVETHTGRPTKVEGNPEHPASLGATNAIMQAACLTLYDPRRSRAPLRGGTAAGWDAFAGALAAAGLGAGRPAELGLALLIDTVTSPTLIGQIAMLRRRYPSLRVYRHEPLAGSDTVPLGAGGAPLRALPHLARARVILSLDADFLGEGPAQLALARAFSERRIVRRGAADMARLYAVESTPTITGAAADHRWAATGSRVAAAARAVGARLGVCRPPSRSVLPDLAAAAIADDLHEAAGAALVLAGPHQPRAVHLLAAAMNAALGGVGSTLGYVRPPEAALAEDGDLGALAAAIDAGTVDALVILGGDPAFTAPGDIDFASALRAVPLSIHSGLYANRTAALCHWHLPGTHPFEAWSDLRAFDGTASLVQPLIRPIYGGRSAHEVLAMLLGDGRPDGLAAVRATWRERGLDDRAWAAALQAGVVPGTAAAAETPAALPEPAPLDDEGIDAGDDIIEVRITPDPWLRAGAGAPNAWLQELPQPLTKIVWGNAALIAPAFADRHGLATGDVVTLTHRGRAVSIPAFVQPGHPDRSATVALGHGADAPGVPGVDVFPLRGADAAWILRGVTVTPSGERRRVVTTQHHHAMEGRDLVRRTTLAGYLADPGLPGDGDGEPQRSLYPEWDYPDEAWGMVVDLGACIGCMACVAACQAENNIPTVGPDECARGHEMHWLRIDRYYAGPAEAPETLFQPVPCMHCEKAPCEAVCPVNATVHTHDGLNAQVYNRCIGTRYCSQNCPYKVRRFNFLEYQPFAEGAGAATAPLMNPDVSVRSRGVMEKCTYCVQRISRARIDAEIAGRPIADGAVVTACQQACPTAAIVFGDLNDPASEVRRLRHHPLDYTLLAELNTRPRTTYLGRVTNPNPRLGGAGAGPGHG